MAGSEVIDVREDERFDESSLAAYLRDHIEGAVGPMAVRQFAGGHANLTYLVTFGNGTEVVVRRPPLGPVAPGSHDMSREHRVLSGLWRSFPQAPRSFLLCEDTDIIGAPFIAMERKRGVVVRKQVPDVFGGGDDHTANRKLSEVVIDTLADFHAITPRSAGLEDLGRPDGYLRRQVDGWTARWHRSKEQDSPAVNELISWLDTNLPASPPASLVHNDWRLDNMAVDAADPGTCVAVYDWDMCTQGDPLADLGTLLSVWYDADEAPAELNPMPTTAHGFMTRSEAISRYAGRTGVDEDAVAYYLVFGSFKMAVVVQQIYIRYRRGQTKDDRFAVMGDAATHLFELALGRRLNP